MDHDTEICLSCKSRSLVDGVCLTCGYSDTINLPHKTNPSSTSNRGTLWALFWCLFLGTPFLSLLAAKARGAVPVFGIGTIAAGFVLSRLFAKSEAAFLLLGILFSIGIVMIYVGVLFFGCIAMMKGSSF
jgi:hypothetical protein